MKMKRMLALVLAFLMAFSLTATAWATETVEVPDEELTVQDTDEEMNSDCFTVTFDHGDGTKHEVPVQKVADPQYGYIGTLTEPEPPTRADANGIHYVFEKWQYDNGDFFYENTATVTMDLTVTAKWIEYLVEGYEVLVTYPDGTFEHVTGKDPIQELVKGAKEYRVQPVQKVMVKNGESASTVATIGQNSYATLQEAVNAANSNDTIITLTDNITLSESVKINKDITIHLDEHNITGEGSRVLDIQSGTVVLTGSGTLSSSSKPGGSFPSSSSVIRVGTGFNANDTQASKASLTVGADVTVSSDCCYGITVFGTNEGTNEVGQELIVYGKVQVTGSEPAISGNGTSTLSMTEITINNGATVSAKNDCAIYHPQMGTLTINGGTIEGKGGIEAKGGKVVVSGGTVTATAGSTSHNTSNDGTSTSGYALAAVENTNYKGNADFTISGGTFTGPVAVVKDNAATWNPSFAISGGTFSTKPDAAYFSAGYVATGTSSGWAVSPKSAFDQAKDLAATYAATHYNKYSNEEVLSGPTDYYVKVSNTTETGSYSFLSGITAEQTFALSIGKNAFIVDKYYKQESDGLYIAFPVILFEMATEAQTLTFSAVNSQDDNVLRVTAGDDANAYTLTYDANQPATKCAKIAINGENSNGILITKKNYTWANGSNTVSYGFTEVDELGSNDGILYFYAFGWNETKVNAGYDGTSLGYSVYSVGQAKTGTLTLNLKVECFHNYDYVPSDDNKQPEWSWRRINGKWDATARFTCSKCGDVQSVDASLQESSGSGEKTTTATATFDGKSYTASKTETLSYPVTLNGENKNSYSWGALCTLTESEPKKWYINDRLVADGRSSYTFAVTENSTVRTEDTTEKDPQAIVSTTLIFNESGKAVFNAKWSLPNDAVVKSAKIYRGYTTSEKAIQSQTLISKVTSPYDTKLLVRNGDFTLNISGLTNNTWQYAVIDIVYEIGGTEYHLTSGERNNDNLYALKVNVH